MTAPVQHPMYIDGQFVAWQGDAWIDVINPATEELISRIPDGRAEDARKAIEAADRARLTGKHCRRLSAPTGCEKLRQVFASAPVKLAR
jgi:acyl-CoA reductase-like NAD-dependent aldehyde dehydrogenase